MAIKPLPCAVPPSRLALRAFTPADAACVAGWSRSPGETFWLAPRTPPPITPQKVVSWAAPGRQQLVLTQAGEVVAYGELNVLVREAGEYWLGHLVVDPQRRGQGLGLELTRRLIDRAFSVLGARRVSLVVFPDNRAAVRCYQSAGMRHEGFESHYFPIYGRRARLSRFAILA